MGSLGGWYRYKLSRPLEDPEVLGMRALAGPLYFPWSQTVVVHENCAWLTERALLTLPNLRIRIEVRPERAEKITALPAIPELREWVPAFMTPFQHAGVHYGSNLDGTLNIAGTGAGKTLLGIVSTLLNPGLIVFVTRAAARRSIAGQIRRYTLCEPLLLEGENPQEIPPDVRFVVVGWETLVHHTRAIIAANPKQVVFDESHMAANHKRYEAIVPRVEDGDASARNFDGTVKTEFRKLTNRFAAGEDISRAVDRRMALTATPIRDRIRNLWGQVDLILPRSFGGFYKWAARFADAHQNPWGGIDTRGRGSPEVMEELVQRLSFFTYYVPQSVTHRELPPKRRQVDYIPAEELSTGRDVLAELREHTYQHGGETWAKLAHAAAMKRSRVVDEAVNGAFRAPDGRSGGKVVVFTGLRKDCEKIAEACTKATAARKKPKEGEVPAPDVKVWIAHGGMTPKQRDVIREEYMAHSGPCILVATGDSMGESIDLHDTDLAIIAMLPWTPGAIRQWEGRFVRLGMKRPVLILYLVAEGTEDERVALALLSKLPAVEQVAKDEVLTSLADDLRGDEQKIVDGMAAKLLADDEDEEEKP